MRHDQHVRRQSFRVTMQAFPRSISRAPLSVLEAWLSTALNTVAGALFVVGSYTILAGMYHSFAPQRVLLGPHTRTLNFWGSAAYLAVRAFCKLPMSGPSKACCPRTLLGCLPHYR